MAAAVEVARGADCQIVEGPYYSAMPSGRVEEAVIEAWKSAFEEAWARAFASAPKPNAIFLVLHGAMVSKGCTDIEASLVEWIRSQEGCDGIPIHAVLDLHGNISQRMTRLINGPVAYRKNPHTDAGEAAARSLQLLIDSLRDARPLRAYWSGTDILWPPSGTGTGAAPMQALEAVARALESRDGLHVANVFAGYAYADTKDTGVSFSVVVDERISENEAEAALEELVRTAKRNQELGIPAFGSESELLKSIPSSGQGPLVVAEPADNIGAGAPGDGTGLLRIFLRHDLQDAGIILNDPDAVNKLEAHEPGETVSLPLGGKGSPLDAGPIQRNVELIRTFLGVFDLEDPQSHLASMAGTRIDMGACALVRLGGITVLVTSRKTPPFDLGQWRVAGVDPENFRVVGVKAAVAHRQAYDPIASGHLMIDTPGPCQSSLPEIPYKHIRRPVFPLDSNTK